MTPTKLLGPLHAGRTADADRRGRTDRAVARLRGGGTCTAAELAAAVGPDTARYALLRARPGSRPALDLAALASATDANPAHRVRFAHARLCAVLRHAAALGLEPGATAAAAASTCRAERELDDLLGRSAPHSPYLLARHLESLIVAVERLEREAPPLPRGDEPIIDTHRARVARCAAARVALADGLRRLDITAPEQM